MKIPKRYNIHNGSDFCVDVKFCTANGLELNPATQVFRFIYKDRYGNGDYEVSFDGIDRKNCYVEDGRLVAYFHEYSFRSGFLSRESYFWLKNDVLPEGKWQFSASYCTNLFIYDTYPCSADAFPCGTIIEEVVITPELKGEPGDSAYQIAVNNGFVGTEEEWLASLKGKKGDTGSQGPQGEKGDTGDTGATGPEGKSAYQVAVDNGYKGTEQEWLASLNGKSAYQVAVEGGYTGTEAEYNELLSTVGDFGSKIDANTDNISALDTRVTRIENQPISLYTSYEGVTYDPDTNLYTVNGLSVNPTTMSRIYRDTAFQIYQFNLKELFYGENISTNLRPDTINFGIASSIIADGDHTCAFMSSSFIKIYITNSNNHRRGAKVWRYAFYNTVQLNEIIGEMVITANAVEADLLNMVNSSAIQTFRLSGLKVNFNMNGAQNVSEESVLWMINNSTNTAPIILTVHANVLARLSEETIALASSKNITITA